MSNLFCESELKESDFIRVSDVIYKHCGINLHDGKRSLVRARLAKRVRNSQFNNYTEYIDYVLSSEGKREFYSFVDSLSTNLTCFFREENHFNYLRKEFLPSLIEERQKKSNLRLRVWSAGCSTGEEAYSLAITLNEEFQNKGNWDIKILASDVSTRVLESAKRGIYDKERITPLNPQQRHRFFVVNKYQGEKIYHVHESLKKMISFRYLNLMEQWPFKGPFDVIFCRNVMIYFDKTTQERLVNRYWDCLGKGGVLCIGHSESLTGINHKYKYVKPATYMKG